MRIMTSIRASIIAVACTAAAVAAGQAPTEPPRFRVSVDVVSTGAVVADRKGNVVRDLTAADFEVFQNGKRQKVTFAQFVPVIKVAAPAAVAIGRAPPRQLQQQTRRRRRRHNPRASGCGDHYSRRR